MDLSDEQKDRRRQLLDRYALIAQLTMLIPLLITQLSFLFKRLWAPGSGRVKKERGSPLPANPPSRRICPCLVTGRKVAWWLDGPIARGWGTRREWIVAGLWAAWLLVLVVKDTGDGMRAFDCLLDLRTLSVYPVFPSTKRLLLLCVSSIQYHCMKHFVYAVYLTLLLSIYATLLT